MSSGWHLLAPQIQNKHLIELSHVVPTRTDANLSGRSLPFSLALPIWNAWACYDAVVRHVTSVDSSAHLAKPRARNAPRSVGSIHVRAPWPLRAWGTTELALLQRSTEIFVTETLTL